MIKAYRRTSFRYDFIRENHEKEINFSFKFVSQEGKDKKKPHFKGLNLHFEFFNIINLQDELKVKTEQMTSLLLENKEKTFLLEQKKDQTEEINQLKEQLDREKKEQLNEIEKLKIELEKEKNKGFFARLFSK